MGSCSEGEEDRFFDTREEFSDSASDCSVDLRSSNGVADGGSGSFGYGLWIKNLQSVNERRDKFFKWMELGLDQNWITRKESGDACCDKFEIETDRVTENSGAVLRISDSEDGVSSNQCSTSFRSNDGERLMEGCISEEDFLYKIKNLDNGTEFVVDELSDDGKLRKLREVGSNRLVTVEEFQKAIGLSPLVQHHLRREVEEVRHSVDMKKKSKRGWLKRLGAVACVVDREGGASLSTTTMGAKTRRVRVHPYRKRSKELSSLYKGQEFAAHKGPISTMKFSLDGRFLASAGDDGIVRVWKVTEDESSKEVDIQDIDPSSVYFAVNDLSELTPLDVDNAKLSKKKRLSWSSDSTCVIFPPKVFRILEKPLHEFQGHSGDILDLSWSKKGYLLSSSTDKTVRLWQVGREKCLRVFHHNNYVTCVDFNPTDDNYFISGSIDGKIRIWEICCCKVVDWTDIKDIVTAVCYRPDGKGGIVGSMTGNCRFYDITDNQLQVDEQICLQSKKKLPGKRITGFQFSPSDPTKLMVASADSLVRMLCGADVICKFRGVRNVGSQSSTSFTADGKHIISASEDSNVHLWNYNNQDKTTSRTKDIWSCESFFSPNASIAVPWCGMKTTTETLPSPSFTRQELQHFGEDLHQKTQKTISSPDCFSAARDFLLESLPRSAPTWPEEKLPDSTPMAVSPAMCRSEYKFLKNACQSAVSSSHTWGLVIVTAGWDGLIRTYQNYGLPLRL